MDSARKAFEHARWVTRTALLLLRRSPERLKTARLIARLYWRERRGRRQDRLELLRLRDGGDVLELCVGDFSDLHVVRETFGSEVYDLPPGFEPRTILDLGANIGASVLWFHRRFPDAEIHAVEPDRRSLEKLRRNAGGLPGVTVHHAAVAGEDSERTFYEAQRGWESSFVASAARSGQAATVTALSLPALMREYVGRERVDLLKLDVEGAEWEILPSVRLSGHADVVVGELHSGMLEDPGAERAALSHGLADFEVRYEGDGQSGHFVARVKASGRSHR
jgi:FkbM family methyltransferase